MSTNDLPRRTAPHENWIRAYTEAPEIFDAFCRAEDPDGRISARLLELADVRGRDVLELGCGTGRYTREWAPGTSFYVGLERNRPMLMLARSACNGLPPRIALVLGDARRLPFADRTFDRVLAGWLLVNLDTAARRTMSSEVSRVLRGGEGAGLWLVENHWSGEFQQLRGRDGPVEERRIRRLVERSGFSVLEVVRTELRFPSPSEARRILGYLCGSPVERELARRPRSRLTHHVVILGRRA